MGIHILGYSLYEILWYFWIYSFLGWGFETIYSSIHEGRLINRGFVTGPSCPIYGVGAVIIVLVLNNFKQNIIVLFIAGVILTSLLEYIVYIIMDKIFNQKWWDYSDLRFNYKGILSLESSIAWGILAVLLIKLIHPLVNLFIGMFNYDMGKNFLLIIIVIFVIDFTNAVRKAVRKSESSQMVILRVKTETLRRILLSFIRK